MFVINQQAPLGHCTSCSEGVWYKNGNVWNHYTDVTLDPTTYCPEFISRLKGNHS